MSNIGLLDMTGSSVCIDKYPLYLELNKIKNKPLKIREENGQEFLADQNKDNTMAVLENVVKQVAQENETGQNSNDDAKNDDKKENIVKCYIKFVDVSGETKKVFECGICSRDFQHQYTLMRHLPIHTDDRNFFCNVCGKSFRQFSTLSQHKAIHSLDRPFSCDICQKSFNRASTLISHKKTHSKEKEFQCHICNKAFHQKGNLRNHVYIHTNERPYKCYICGKGFNQMSNLVCHNQKSHVNDCLRLWKCNFCDRSFSKRTALRSHEFEAHHILMNKCKSSKSNIKKITNPTSTSITSSASSTSIASSASSSSITSSSTSTTKLIYEDQDFQIPTTAGKKTLGCKTSFAILHKIEKDPCIVKIVDCKNGSFLKRVYTEDLVMISKEGKSIVPVLAHIYETINSIGEIEFVVKRLKIDMFNDKNQDHESTTKIDINQLNNCSQTNNISILNDESYSSANSSLTWHSEHKETVTNSWMYNNFTPDEANNVNLINVDTSTVGSNIPMEIPKPEQLNQNAVFHGGNMTNDDRANMVHALQKMHNSKDEQTTFCNQDYYIVEQSQNSTEEMSHQSLIYSNGILHLENNFNAIQNQATDFPITLQDFLTY